MGDRWSTLTFLQSSVWEMLVKNDSYCSGRCSFVLRCGYLNVGGEWLTVLAAFDWFCRFLNVGGDRLFFQFNFLSVLSWGLLNVSTGVWFALLAAVLDGICRFPERSWRMTHCSSSLIFYWFWAEGFWMLALEYDTLILQQFWIGSELWVGSWLADEN